MWLLQLHVLLAVASGVGFLARGLWKLGWDRSIESRALRTAPHVLDTLLLASGVALAVRASISPLYVEWFGLKLGLIVLYILLGVGAFRARRIAVGWLLFAGAVCAWSLILGVALNRSRFAWFA